MTARHSLRVRVAIWLSLAALAWAGFVAFTVGSILLGVLAFNVVGKVLGLMP